MPLLIDGYNLLQVSGIFARGRRGHTLEGARHALLAYLADALAPDERPRTSIVFDAKDAPPGLPREEKFRGIAVFFAARHEEADDLIEELIRAESSPRQLTVVSSDHRIQRAARRRRAEAVDSDRWFNALSQEVERREHNDAFEESKPDLPLSEDNVADWLREFGVGLPLDVAVPPANQRDDGADDESAARQDTSPDEKADGAWNPFPPGYAEDLLDDD